VNVSRVEQRSLARRFAAKTVADPFTELAYESAGDGGARAGQEHSVATHTIFVGTVRACAYRDGALGVF